MPRNYGGSAVPTAAPTPQMVPGPARISRLLVRAAGRGDRGLTQCLYPVGLRRQPESIVFTVPNMCTIIPSITVSKASSPGERRFARLIEAKLDDGYLCWYDVPVGPQRLQPDFIILHPERGIVIIEVCDWFLENIQTVVNKASVRSPDSGIRSGRNPLEQARDYALAVADLLKGDPQLVAGEGRNSGQLLFPLTYGVVLTRITRRAFEKAGLGEVMPPHRVICQDEMVGLVVAGALQQRLWEMFTAGSSGVLNRAQIDRIRWHLFPEVRLPDRKGSLFDQPAGEPQRIPGAMRVMDQQQEQLARSLGDGHRVVHGVAGSGKTLLLGTRAEHLARVCSQPILVLCYNRPLAQKLEEWMQAKGIGDKVHVQTFHAWCRRQLRNHSIVPPPNCGDNSRFFDEMVETMIHQVERGTIPSGQYDAVMIDEGHDFRPEWFRLAVRMVNPRTNSLLVLYDDAQSIHDTHRKGRFSFKEVGIQAQGRTTILRVNYRNTREILDFAAGFAGKLLSQVDADDDGIPRLAPVSAGRSGTSPLLIKLPTIRDEAGEIARRLKEANRKGIAWKDMAVLYWDDGDRREIHRALSEPHAVDGGSRVVPFAAGEDRLTFLTFKSSKGLEFPLVAIMGGRISEQAREDAEAAKLLYVAMTRARSLLVMTVAGNASATAGQSKQTSAPGDSPWKSSSSSSAWQSVSRLPGCS